MFIVSQQRLFSLTPSFRMRLGAATAVFWLAWGIYIPALTIPEHNRRPAPHSFYAHGSG